MSNKAKVKVLKMARDRIDKRGARFICIALMVCAFNREERRAADALRTKIMELLEGYGSLDSWLISKGFSVTLKDKEELRQTRLNWIDHLIKEYSK